MKAIISVFLLLFFTASCKKIESNAKYSISGRMYKDCNATPFALYDLRLKFKGGVFSNYETKEWYTTTDLQGNFTFTDIPVTYRSSLYLAHVIDEENLVRWRDNINIPPVTDKQIFDLGTFYATSEATAIVKLSINTSVFGSNDTLYVGQSNAPQKVYPIPPSTTIIFKSSYNIPGLVNSSTDFTYPIYWGKNGKDFDSSWKKGHHLLKAKFGLCSIPDTSHFSIP